MKVLLLNVTPIDTAIKAIRRCYKSEGRSDSSIDVETYEHKLGTKDKARIEGILESDHTSTIEHISFTFDISEVSRALTHQLVRHRIASYSQESQRYVKLNSDEQWYIMPKTVWERQTEEMYIEMMKDAKSNYHALLSMGVSKEDARMVLPNATHTSLIMTINARSLRNFFKERLAPQAQWEIRELAKKMYDLIPETHKILFKGVTYE